MKREIIIVDLFFIFSQELSPLIEGRSGGECKETHHIMK